MAQERILSIKGKGEPMNPDLAGRMGLKQRPGGEMVVATEKTEEQKLAERFSQNLTVQVPKISELKELKSHEELAAVLGSITDGVNREVKKEMDEANDIRPDLAKLPDFRKEMAENRELEELLSPAFRVTKEKIESIGLDASDITALFIGQELRKRVEVAPGMFVTFRSLGRDELDLIDQTLLEKARDVKDNPDANYTYFQMQRDADVRVLRAAIVEMSWMEFPKDMEKRDEILRKLPAQVYNLVRHWHLCFDAAVKLSLTEGNLKKS